MAGRPACRFGRSCGAAGGFAETGHQKCNCLRNMTNNAGVGFGRTRGGEGDLSTVRVTDDLAALRNVSSRFFPAGDDCLKSEGIRCFLVSIGSLAFAAFVTNSHMACTPLPL
jgi:hypothetical protein